ncbi:MAG: DUF3570 domain-containing protein [Bradymonadaceae bacterium]
MGTLLIIVTLSAWGAGCSGGDRAQVLAGYRDYRDPTVEVKSPRVEGAGDLPGGVSLGVYWAADVISAATPVMNAPDTMSRATEFRETRHEAGVSLGWEARTTMALSTEYAISSEPDYLSQATSIRVESELLERMATLSATGRLQLDRIGHVDLVAFDESMRSVGGLLAWSHILHPHVVAHLAYSLEHRAGFQSNPYRYVPMGGDEGGPASLMSSEYLPRRRTRHAWEGLAIWAATGRLFLRGGYRFYGDDWAIRSHTLYGESWHVFFDDRLRLRLRLRGYTQEGAEFFRDRHGEGELFRSGDYRLGPMSSLGGGARFDVRLSRYTLMLGYDATYYRLHDTAFYPEMLGRVLSVGLTTEWP